MVHQSGGGGGRAGGAGMLKITLLVDRPAGQAIGIKEAVAQDLEKYGDVEVVRIEEIRTAEQMRMEEMK